MPIALSIDLVVLAIATILDHSDNPGAQEVKGVLAWLALVVLAVGVFVELINVRG